MGSFAFTLLIACGSAAGIGGFSSQALGQTVNVWANDPRISYSDYVRLQFVDSVTRANTKMARFDRLIDQPQTGGTPTGYQFDNPGARVRFRTDATTVTALLYYNDKHVRFQARNGKGVYFMEIAPDSTNAQFFRVWGDKQP